MSPLAWCGLAILTASTAATAGLFAPIVRNELRRRRQQQIAAAHARIAHLEEEGRTVADRAAFRQLLAEHPELRQPTDGA